MEKKSVEHSRFYLTETTLKKEIDFLDDTIKELEKKDTINQKKINKLKRANRALKRKSDEQEEAFILEQNLWIFLVRVRTKFNLLISKINGKLRAGKRFNSDLDRYKRGFKRIATRTIRTATFWRKSKTTYFD